MVDPKEEKRAKLDKTRKNKELWYLLLYNCSPLLQKVTFWSGDQKLACLSNQLWDFLFISSHLQAVRQLMRQTIFKIYYTWLLYLVVALIWDSVLIRGNTIMTSMKIRESELYRIARTQKKPIDIFLSDIKLSF